MDDALAERGLAVDAILQGGGDALLHPAGVDGEEAAAGAVVADAADADVVVAAGVGGAEEHALDVGREGVAGGERGERGLGLGRLAARAEGEARERGQDCGSAQERAERAAGGRLTTTQLISAMNNNAANPAQITRRARA